MTVEKALLYVQTQTHNNTKFSLKELKNTTLFDVTKHCVHSHILS